MGILGIYKIAMTHKKLGISKEILATRILPFLIPLCIENGLTLAQFGAITSLVKDMFQAVENEHRTKLEQLNTVKDEQKILKATMPTVTTPNVKPAEVDAFAGLELAPAPASCLSMEQKQALARQQDSLKLFSNQPSIEPKKAVNPVANQPKDLTANLLGGDLLDNTPKTINSNNNSNLRQLTGGFAAPPIGFNNINNSNQNFGPWMGGPTTQTSTFKPQGAAVQQNWSALDSLLPASLNNATSRTPMNKMGGGRVPLLPQTGGSSNQSASNNNHQLSKSDLLDFLN